MELVGDEKRIQALFCEQRLVDQRLAPEFDIEWNGAKASTSQQWPTLPRSFIVITCAMVVVVICLLTWSSRTRLGQLLNQDVASVPPQYVSFFENWSIETKGKAVSGGSHRSVKSTQALHRFEARRKTEPDAEAMIHEAVAISSWQSPTVRLMEGPVTSGIESLPQLNQSARALRSFLTSNQ